MKFFYTLLLTFFTTISFSQNYDYGTMSSRLIEKLEAAGEDDYLHVSILLADQFDVRALDADLYARNASLEQRAFELITSLQNKAAATQGPILDYLMSSGKVLPESVHGYWIANTIFAKVQAEALADLSRRSDIAWLDLNSKLVQTEYEVVEAPPATAVVPDGVEPGLRAINAHKLWAMGYTGYGLVTFVNDTGVDPIHPAFRMKFRGFYAPAEQSWFQFNSNNLNPFDCGSHGTHVLGTMVGLDRATSDTIGVAFNSLWVGAPILCGIGTEDNVASFQWALNPDENPSTIEDMPTAINNSWYDPSLQGEDCNSVYVPVLDALEASGVAVVFSAGNAGPGTASITPPHNINTDLVNSMTVAAVDGNDSDLDIADFSSRGPSACGGTGSILIKPEVAAPGVGVRSSVLNEGYDYFSGTSMASPHVVGAILLLKEAFPNLTGTELKLALYYNCNDLGEPGEDNTYGMGIIDVYKAYQYLIDLGNTPVSPLVDRDVMLIDAGINDIACDGAFSHFVRVENAGQETITEFKVTYDLEGAPGTQGEYIWEGTMEPGDRVSIDLPMFENIDIGEFLYKVNLSSPNDLIDDRPLNNKYQESVVSLTPVAFEANLESIEQATACSASSVVLRADLEGEGTVEWYTQADGGNPIAEGDILELDGLEGAATQTYYADARISRVTGMEGAENTISDLEVEGGILFDAHYPFRLMSAKVYVEQPTYLQVQIRDVSTGDGVAGLTYILEEAGEQRLDLGLNIPAREDLEMRIVFPATIKHAPSGANYPYEVEDVLTIKGNTSTTEESSAYFYFFDWEIEYQRQCERVPVMVEIDSIQNSAEAAFVMSAQEIDLAVDSDITFTDNSTNATSWSWNFGDGNVSTMQSPTHTFADTGQYIVTLTVADVNGCTDATLDTVYVRSTLVSTSEVGLPDHLVDVFPVPTQDEVILSFQLPDAQRLSVGIFDLLGREVLHIGQRLYQQEQVSVDLEQLSNGVYFVRVQSDDGQLVKKIIKSK